ncbi:MAG TPA: PA0069 family radical SAM protein [Polyangiaceae bacterium LLY-WYZ-15_(1-7)]|nr:PA0069 family radical SAM protein [Polyangiaceae bacterium LLY-WYZ-15_(1-7)]HJL06053.1 PA0069 family radical SAM protein [Polyangiaceae bacterium LLY-WYZ-15_(1-7)]HJL07021.1 PA0069 family radical SAM protein [Polyangiaceae bacterium LLY-WYZ-15_(1-7)]HJL34991.1 PA0069 family radical SAM protein [Polyangiaceae bacterium LLY-WYZ-15_(1-7)]HJL46668.1 PA0069 family radical SAM protein [Polyangiaceae bacterium LLY-WYZ-15_(1-7)]
MPRPVANPPNPFEEASLEWDGPPPPAKLEVFEEDAKSALSRNDSPDVGFTWSVNPYRGCFHACAYCYARPSHQYWGFGAGTDFDRKIVVKRNVAERLREAFERPSWKGETIAFSGNTDCYQPLEASYGLTRACLEVCRAFRQPVSLITKSKLIRRDADLLGALAREARCHVTVSIPFADDAMARKMEPFASPPTKRFETVRVLAEAGVPVGISVGPIIPGLNDDQIPTILERAVDAGARSAFAILLRLPKQVLPVFDARLEAAFPMRAEKVRSAIRMVRGGKANESRFGDRMRGRGARWDAIEQLFELHLRKHGLARTGVQHFEGPTTFERPTPQLSLF